MQACLAVNNAARTLVVTKKVTLFRHFPEYFEKVDLRSGSGQTSDMPIMGDCSINDINSINKYKKLI